MKTIFLFFCIVLIQYNAFSQDTSAALKIVTVTLYNNSKLPENFSFITYAPDETGNGTNQVLLSPYAKIKRSYKTGTKLYIANKKQVTIVMSGKKLSGEPFKIISAADDGTTINLNEK